MKKLFEYEYKSGKKIVLYAREDETPLIIIEEYNKDKLVKNFFTTLTAISNVMDEYETRRER